MPDFSRTGNWEVVTEKKDGEEERHVFDAVICCWGHNSYPNMPLKDFPGKKKNYHHKSLLVWSHYQEEHFI